LINFFKQFAFAREHQEHQVDALSGAGAPGEAVTLSFAMRAQTSCQAIEINSGLLKGSRQTIPSGSVDLYIVKVWEQAGIGLYQSESMMVPELLLKDDRITLKDGYRRCFKRLRHLVQPYWLYVAPAVRLTGPILTSLEPGKAKQVLVSIRVPLDAPPGHYDGELIFKCNGDTQRLNVNLEVYPITLAQSRQDALLFYRGSLDWRQPQHYVTEDQYRLQLEDIYRTGFRSVSINETDTQLTQHAIEIAEEIGFDRHLLIFWPRSNDLQKLRFRKTTPIYLVSDELDLQLKRKFANSPDLRQHPQVVAAKQNAAAIKTVGGRTLSTAESEPAARALFADLELKSSDLQSYYLPKNVDYFFIRKQFEEMRKSEAYYHWPAFMEKPDLHRVLAGVYLWKSGADGIQPYCYQHLPQYPFSAYNDFDEWEPGADVESEPRAFKDHLSTYPAQDGPIPTLQWFGMREGLTDLRYLNTLDYALVQTESDSSAEARECVGAIREEMENFLARIDLRSISIKSETDPNPYSQIQSHEYQGFRKFCAESIMQLQKLTASVTPSEETTCVITAGTQFKPPP
jgi:hypothetical protein